MPMCKNCNCEFPNRIKLNGKTRYLNKRSYCLECSPPGERRARHREQITEKVCTKCNRTQLTSDFYKLKRGGYTPNCKSCLKKDTKNRLQKTKAQCVSYKGGSCTICGYNKYLGALDFHHKDELTKDYKISDLQFHSFKNIKAELDKCILVCANCHREIHGGVINI